MKQLMKVLSVLLCAVMMFSLCACNAVSERDVLGSDNVDKTDAEIVYTDNVDVAAKSAINTVFTQYAEYSPDVDVPQSGSMTESMFVAMLKQFCAEARLKEDAVISLLQYVSENVGAVYAGLTVSDGKVTANYTEKQVRAVQDLILNVVKKTGSEALGRIAFTFWKTSHESAISSAEYSYTRSCSSIQTQFNISKDDVTTLVQSANAWRYEDEDVISKNSQSSPWSDWLSGGYITQSQFDSAKATAAAKTQALTEKKNAYFQEIKVYCPSLTSFEDISSYMTDAASCYDNLLYLKSLDFEAQDFVDLLTNLLVMVCNDVDSANSAQIATLVNTAFNNVSDGKRPLDEVAFVALYRLSVSLVKTELSMTKYWDIGDVGSSLLKDETSSGAMSKYVDVIIDNIKAVVLSLGRLVNIADRITDAQLVTIYKATKGSADVENNAVIKIAKDVLSKSKGDVIYIIESLCGADNASSKAIIENEYYLDDLKGSGERITTNDLYDSLMKYATEVSEGQEVTESAYSQIAKFKQYVQYNYPYMFLYEFAD